MSFCKSVPGFENCEVTKGVGGRSKQATKLNKEKIINIVKNAGDPESK